MKPERLDMFLFHEMHEQLVQLRNIVNLFKNSRIAVVTCDCSLIHFSLPFQACECNMM